MGVVIGSEGDLHATTRKLGRQSELGVVSVAGFGQSPNWADDDRHLVAGDEVEDVIGALDVVEDHLQVEFVRNTHGGEYFVAGLGGENNRPFAAKIRNESFHLQVT